jgi:hypothetical protein
MINNCMCLGFYVCHFNEIIRLGEKLPLFYIHPPSHMVCTRYQAWLWWLEYTRIVCPPPQCDHNAIKYISARFDIYPSLADSTVSQSIDHLQARRQFIPTFRRRFQLYYHCITNSKKFFFKYFFLETLPPFYSIWRSLQGRGGLFACGYRFSGLHAGPWRWGCAEEWLELRPAQD